MKALPREMQAHLSSGATTLCWCFRLARGDGQILGFTDHDRDVTIDGVSYEAASGFTASAVQSQTGLAVDNLTAAGALSSDSLNEDDLAAGLFDNAAFEMWRVNWSDVNQRVLIRKGHLGEITRGRTGFVAELRGLAHVLNQVEGRIFGHACDADLGDLRCGINLGAAAYRATGLIAAVTDSRRFCVSGLSGFVSGWFAQGLLTFRSGANEGRAGEIKRHAATPSTVIIELWQPMSSRVVDGDRFEIVAGCDKQFATCRTKFANCVNFRGFPYVPGSDAALGYPASGQPMDGGSRYGN